MIDCVSLCGMYVCNMQHTWAQVLVCNCMGDKLYIKVCRSPRLANVSGHHALECQGPSVCCGTQARRPPVTVHACGQRWCVRVYDG